MDSQTFMIFMVVVLVVATGVILGIWLYFERSKGKRRVMAKKNRTMEPEDEAYNMVVSTKSICNVLSEKGYDMTPAEILLGRAELALEARDYPKTTQLVEEAKERIKSSREAGIKLTPGDSFVPEEETDVKEFEETKKQMKSLPDNYMESKFQIEVARDLMDEKGTDEAKMLLDKAEALYADEDYSGALSYAVRCKKCIDGKDAGVISALKVDRVKPTEEHPEVPVKVVSERDEDLSECGECGAMVNSDDKFCNKCGAKIVSQVICSECGTEVSSEYNFCPGCGTGLVVMAYECPECATEVDDKAKFCPNCGVGLE